MLIDSHAHIQMRPFAADRADVVRRANAAGVTTLIVVGTDIESSRDAIAVAHSFEHVYSTVGVHPHDATALDDRAIDELRALTQDQTVLAIGEIGLDYYRDRSPRDAQRTAFRRQLELAAELELPVVVHDRDAHEDTYRLLETWAGQRRRAGATGPLGVRHCWSGPGELAQAYQAIGFMISIAGNVTYPGAAEIVDAAANASDTWLLVETDCPYLSPVPIRGKRNEPAFVVNTAEFVAQLRGSQLRQIAQLASDNARRLFRIPNASEKPARGT